METHCGNTLWKHTVETYPIPQTPYHPTGGVIGTVNGTNLLDGLHSITTVGPMSAKRLSRGAMIYVHKIFMELQSIMSGRKAARTPESAYIGVKICTGLCIFFLSA